MPQLVSIILTTIAPIIIVAGLGALLDRTKVLDPRTVSRIAIYLAIPALAFYGIANSTITSYELGILVLFSLLSTLTITGLAWLVTIWFKMKRLTASAFILSVALINLSNYGIPLNEFAYGQPGLERALILAVLGFVYANTAGVFIASWGRASVLRSFLNVFTVPAPYAAVLGLAVNAGYLSVPELVFRVTDILRGAAIPLMLIMLGIQISRASLKGDWSLILGASSMRLVGGAAVGFMVAAWLGLAGVTRQVAIVEASMPTAVTAVILATEFKSEAKLTSSVILVSTVLSIFTLSIILAILAQ
jgi:predicted permease